MDSSAVRLQKYFMEIHLGTQYRQGESKLYAKLLGKMKKCVDKVYWERYTK